MYEETLATYGAQLSRQYTGSYFPLKFYYFFFPYIKPIWSFQRLYGRPILSQDCSVFEHPGKMPAFSNLGEAEGCPLPLREECEWPQPKPWRSRPPLEYFMPLGREGIYLRFSSLKAKLNVQIIHVHSRKIRKYRKAERKMRITIICSSAPKQRQAFHWILSWLSCAPCWGLKRLTNSQSHPLQPLRTSSGPSLLSHSLYNSHLVSARTPKKYSLLLL